MDIDEINEHIRKLKCEETSWQSVNKLAALCTVRDELKDEDKAKMSDVTTRSTPAPIAYSTAAEPPKSEFVEAASSVPFSGLMGVLDEHMNAIKLVYPKEYQLVLKKIKILLD